MNISSKRSKTKPAKFISALLALHMVTSSIFVYYDSAWRARFSFPNFEKICRHLSFWRKSVFEKVSYFFKSRHMENILPSSSASITFDLSFTRTFDNKSRSWTSRFRTFSCIWRAVDVKIAKFVFYQNQWIINSLWVSLHFWIFFDIIILILDFFSLKFSLHLSKLRIVWLFVFNVLKHFTSVVMNSDCMLFTSTRAFDVKFPINEQFIALILYPSSHAFGTHVSVAS